MKKHILLGAALLSLFAASCSNEDVIDNGTEVVTGKTITLNASINNGANTRLIYTDDADNNKMKVAWSTSESFTMYKGTITKGSTFSNSTDAKGTFKGDDITGDGNYYAVYGEGIVNNNGILSIDIADQTGTSTENGIKEFMLATAETLGDDTKLTFDHKLAVLKLSLALPEGSTSETKATKITITGLHKKATYDLSKDAYAYQATDNGVITATNGETGYAIEGGKIKAYIAVFPEKIEANSLIITTEIGSQSYVYTVKSSAQLPAGKVTPVTANLAKVLYCTSGTLTADAVKAAISNNNLVIASDKDLTSADFTVLRSVLGSSGGYADGTINLTLLNQTSLPVTNEVEDTGALEECVSLKSVSAPNVTVINDYALYECTNLTSVSLPKATSVGEEAFYSCLELTTVSLPEATFVEGGAFADCTELTTVSLPKVTSVGNKAFAECTELTTLSLPKATSVAASAFDGCDRSKIDLTTSDASNWYKELGGTETDKYGWKSLNIIKVNFKSAYTKEDYFYWDAYTYVTNGNETFGDGGWGYNTSFDAASHSCASCPTASQMVAYLKAGVYWDDDVTGEGQLTYSVPTGNGSEIRQNLHTGLWVKKKSKIENFDSEAQMNYTTTDDTFKKLSTLTADQVKQIRTGGDYFFLPAAGYYRNNGAFYGADVYGYYWASSPYNDDNVYYLRFMYNHATVSLNTRDYGLLPMVAE